MGLIFVPKIKRKGTILLFVLTDGKNYVMENPLKVGEYLSTTSPVNAKHFTYKQARSLVNRKGKKYSWVKGYQLVDMETGEKSKHSLNYKGNADVYVGEDMNDNVLEEIVRETNSILGLAGWDTQQLSTYHNLLSTELSKCDSAESDINHALQDYKSESNGKKPQAHKMAKIGYLLYDIRDRRKKVKQCILYIQVMEDAITYQYSVSKLKLELSKVQHEAYRGRTKYYNEAMDILSGK